MSGIFSRFQEAIGIISGVKTNKILSAPLFNVRMGSQFLYQKRLFDQIRSLEGDIVECGVGHGKSFLSWCILCIDEGAHRKIWGFDSFEGFPAPTIEDRSPRNPQQGEWQGTSLAAMTSMLVNSGLSREWFFSNVTLVTGFFEESLPKYTGKNIALLHLDVDLYGSYKTALECLYPLVCSGGVIAFDEYMGTNEHYKFPGAKKAIDEFFANRPIKLQRDQVWGKYYIVKTEQT
jgi:hypothetical protein